MLHKALLGSLIMMLSLSAGWSGEEKNGDNQLPGFPNIACDAKLLEAGGKFKIAKTGSLVPKGQTRRVVVFWLLEARSNITDDFEEIRAAWGVRPSDSDFRGPRLLFKDADKVMTEDVFLSVQGFHRGMKRGDGVRVFIEVPRDVIDNTRFTAIVP